jgi:hypothetical protein
VPGKVVLLNELELVAQVSALNKLEEQWRKKQANEEYNGRCSVVGMDETGRNVQWTACHVFCGSGPVDRTLDRNFVAWTSGGDASSWGCYSVAFMVKWEIDTDSGGGRLISYYFLCHCWR